MSTVSAIWDCSDEEYFADKTHLTSTMIRTFMESIPKYHKRYVTGEMKDDEDTEALTLGSAVHCMILYGWDKFKDSYAVAPECDRRTKDGKATYQAFLDDSKGKTPIPSWMYHKVCAMADSVRNHKIANNLLHEQEGKNELAIRWEDTWYGLNCKCKFDRLLSSGGVVDLKTSRRPYPYQYHYEVRDKRYHVQGGFYLLGRDHLIGNSNEPYYHVVVDNEPPYEVVVYQFPDEAIKEGIHLIHVAMDELCTCIDSDNWKSRYLEMEELYWRGNNGRP